VSTDQAETRPDFPDDWRTRVIEDPELILEDRDLMRALISANDRQMGGNIVDMRGIAMERLQNRLDRLEDTHRSVIAAAYENLAGHQPDPPRGPVAARSGRDFTAFLTALGTDVAGILRVDRIRLVLESTEATETEAPRVQKLEDVLTVVAPGFVEDYVTGGRDIPSKQVTLRQVTSGSYRIFGDEAVGLDPVRGADPPRSRANGRLPGLLVMGAEDPHQFRPTQGTDLLTFFAGVFERLMRGWLD
jgi:hypothetical protein